MTVTRIVPNFRLADLEQTKTFYQTVFGLDVVMDQGWILTFASNETAPAQISFAVEGGSGTEVPDVSIEVEDVNEVYRLARKSGAVIAYDITDEPWGVRRFYLRDPNGVLVNVLSHRRTD